MLVLTQGAGVAVTFEATPELDELQATPGFQGAAVLRSITDTSKTATLIFLADPECTALHGGSSAYKVAAVRLQAAPDDHDGRMVVQEDDGVVLIVRMDGGIGGTDEALHELQTSTDTFLPEFSAVRGVSFMRSPDHTRIIEFLQADSAAAMKMIQTRADMKEHEQKLGDMLQSLEADLYSVEAIVAPAVG